MILFCRSFLLHNFPRECLKKKRTKKVNKCSLSERMSNCVKVLWCQYPPKWPWLWFLPECFSLNSQIFAFTRQPVSRAWKHSGASGRRAGGGIVWRGVEGGGGGVGNAPFLKFSCAFGSECCSTVENASNWLSRCCIHEACWPSETQEIPFQILENDSWESQIFDVHKRTTRPWPVRMQNGIWVWVNVQEPFPPALPKPANIDLSESPPKWSGSTRRRVRGSECQSGQEESSPNLSWSDGMGSCLSSGKVGGFIFVFYVL